MWTPEILILTAVIFTLGGIVKGVAGIGLPTVAIALMAVFIGLKEGIALMVVPTVVTNIWQALVGGHLIELSRRFWSFLAAGAVGAWLGAGVLAVSDGMMLAAMLGALLCLYSAVSLITPQIPSPGRAEGWMSPVIGSVSGVIGGMTGSIAVPGVLYMQALRLNRDQLVQAMGITFFAFTAVLGLSLAHHGVMSADIGALSAAAVIPALAGMAVGQRLRRRLSEARFRKVFFIVLFALGLWLAVRPFIG